MENLEKIQEIGTTEKAWIEYAKSIDRNNERLYLYTKENVSDAIGHMEGTEVYLNSQDAANIRWNGSYFVESMDDGYNGVAIKCVKGATYTPLNERVTYYVFDYEPKVGEEKRPIEVKQSTLDSWTAEQSGLYLWFNFPTREQISVNMSVDGVGIKDGIYSNKISIGSLLDTQQITEFSKGNELIRKKKNFKWKEFEKPIITLRCDDLNSDVDLVVKIVNDAGLPIVIAAPANKLTRLVNGIIMSDEKIGDTCVDVCQFVVKNGGEIVEHSIDTFTSEDYQTSIKPIFIDSKVEFMKIGIDIRGASVSNLNPNDDLRNKLAPYLYFYYEYSNGYGQNLPYSYGDNNFSGFNDGSVKTLEQFKPILENAINQKSHKTYIIHSLSSSGIPEEEYRKIVNYVLEKKNAGEIDVMTWAEVYDKYGIFE